MTNFPSGLQCVTWVPEDDCSPVRRPTAPPQATAPAAAAAAVPNERSQTTAQTSTSQPLLDESEDPDMIPETPVEKVDIRQKPTERRVTRQTVKEENVSVTIPPAEFQGPMLEVSGPDGPVIVFLPWTLAEMKQAMEHLPSPEEASDKFAEELGIFCREFSPTMYELKKMMALKLGPMNWYKEKGLLRRPDCRKEHRDWDNRANGEYREAVLELAEAVRTAFPVRIGITKINDCMQERGETVHAFYHRLTELFNKHGGIPEPAERGAEPGLWECYMSNCYTKGLREDIARGVKASLVGWADSRLADLLKYALHVETQLEEEKAEATRRTAEEDRLATMRREKAR